MAVSFNSIDPSVRVPLFYAEVDNSQANSGATMLRRLIVAQVNTGSTSPEVGQLVLVSSAAQAAQIGGAGSMLHAMYAALRKSDPFGEVWCLPVLVETGAAATAKVAVTGAAVAGGMISLYVAGQRVRAAVGVGDTAADVCAAIAAAINAVPDLPASAAVVEGEVELTAKFVGELGNDITLVLNRLGRMNGEVTPAGLTLTLTAFASGTGTPDLVEASAALGDEAFEFIIQPWSDVTSLNAWRDIMNDSSGRWAWTKQVYGHVYTARRGALGALVAHGQARNDPHMTINGFEAQEPAPCWVKAAAFGGRQAVFISADPSRPTQTGALIGLEPAPASSRWLLLERQSLLSYGIATTVYAGGALRIERAVTTYQRNAYDQPDDSYLDSETMHQTAHIHRFIQSRITSKYGRHKLANDGTRYGAGQAIVTPSVLRGEMIAAYFVLETQGHVENAALFAKYLIVERDAQNPNRVNVLFPPDYVNQLRVFALRNEFRLQYPQAA